LYFKFLSSLRKQSHGEKRSALLRLAILSSALSKVGGLALQALAIPLVYRSLGQHRYELYLLLTAALATIVLAQMGAGPGLTQGLAKASATGRRDHEAALLNAAFRVTGMAAIVGGIGILVFIHLISPGYLFGAAFAGDRAEVLNVANVCVLMLMVQMVSGVVDSALAGYQEQVFSNVGMMIANVISIGLLFVVCEYAPSIVNVILVLYGVPTLSRLVNLVILYRRKPYLLQGVFHSTREFYPVLLNVGLAFWTIQVGGLLEQHSGTYVLAHLSSTESTNLFAIVYKSLALAGAAVGIVTQPLWPAFTDAIAHRDIAWIHRSFAKIRRALTIYSIVIAAGMLTVGPWIFERVVHVDTTGSFLMFCVLGIYFIANIWTHLLYVTMMGMRGIWKLALVSVSENLLMLVFGILLVPRFGGLGMAIAYLAASIALPAWLLPRMMATAIKKISDVPLVAGKSA
jgi:O-antigen/teichoic acid export membrane protein